MRALLVESILRVMVAIDLLGSTCVGGTYLGQVGRVGQVGQVGRRAGAPEGCHSASPRSRLAEPMTGGS